MKTLARERFCFVKEQSDKKDNKIIIKIGLPIDADSQNSDNLEHIWFELISFEEEKFKARLLQEPYDALHMHEGDEAWFTVNDVTDWMIYTPEFSVTPGTAYRLV